jgi:hypothetical protein
VHPQPASEKAWPLDFGKLPAELKTESFKVCRPLSHFGQAILEDLDITNCS